METIKKEWQAKVATVLLIVLTIWWRVAPSFSPTPEKRFLGDFISIYVIMAIWGMLWGLLIAQKWGGIHSVIGKALLFFSAALGGQIFGQIAYAYYPLILHTPTPYPTIGDIGYFSSIPFSILGTFYLAKASGVAINLRTYKQKIQALFIPFIMLFLGYLLFLQGYKFDWNHPASIILEFVAPLGQATYVSFAILTYLLSKGVLGGIMKNKVIFILFALCFQFLSDYVFLYQASRGTWLAGGINDYMYLFSYFLMTLALLQFKTVFDRLQSKSP